MSFFERCSALLEPTASCFCRRSRSTTAPTGGRKRARTFSNTLIFPGGCLPSLSAMQRSVARRTDMRPVRLEDIGSSYVLTLRHWRGRFMAASKQLAELGYDERFRRLWEMYFAISEAGFHEARLRDLQLVYAKPAWPGVAPGPRHSQALSRARRAPVSYGQA